MSAVAAVASDHLRIAGTALRRGRGFELPALMHCMLGRGVLARLQRSGYNPFDTRVSETAAGEVWRLLMARIVGRAALPRS